jgi:ribosomal protein S17
MSVVATTKMTPTIVVRRDYLHFVPKYQRYEKPHSNLSAHVSPAFRVKEGDSDFRPVQASVQHRQVQRCEGYSCRCFRWRKQEVFRSHLELRITPAGIFCTCLRLTQILQILKAL